MDGWTEVYTDSDGLKRCKRCNHVRPTQNQEQQGLEDTPQQPLSLEDRAARATVMQRKLMVKKIRELRAAANVALPAQ
jgi:hypothetical protein